MIAIGRRPAWWRADRHRRRLAQAGALGLVAAFPKCGLCVIAWLAAAGGAAGCGPQPSWSFAIAVLRQRTREADALLALPLLAAAAASVWWRRRPRLPAPAAAGRREEF